MLVHFQRTEKDLKIANEFIDDGEKQIALDALNVIISRKDRMWEKMHGPIMSKYMELYVELKKSQVTIASFENIVSSYFALIEEMAETALIKDSQQGVVDIDDLDQVQNPQNLLLSDVNSEDRTDHVLTQWVEFLWESYRKSLELLYNNSRVERLYHVIAQKAFHFCVKYNRKPMFRKLCDNLRVHLGHIYKNQNQQTSANWTYSESQTMHLKILLVQLDSAFQMELREEAYETIESIHSLMNPCKKAPNPVPWDITRYY